jgi:16S rRNA (uracil1498-N3)-methyltransferase
MGKAVLYDSFMAKEDFIKLPRLYVDHELSDGGEIELSPPQTHYLRNVLRRGTADDVRVFNGRDGEWLAALDFGKKSVTARLRDHLKLQPPEKTETHLLFAPIKKDAMDFLIEKAVELGVTHLHPVLTQNTEVRRVNEDRVRTQIIEAAEQCERLTIPTLAAITSLSDIGSRWNSEINLYACIERRAANPLTGPFSKKTAFLIGPEGGFTEEEKEKLGKLKFVVPVNLGESILRAETAALLCLSARKLSNIR